MVVSILSDIISFSSSSVAAHLPQMGTCNQGPIGNMVRPEHVEAVTRAHLFHPFALVPVAASAEIDLVDMVDVDYMLEQCGGQQCAGRSTPDAVRHARACGSARRRFRLSSIAPRPAGHRCRQARSATRPPPISCSAMMPQEVRIALMRFPAARIDLLVIRPAGFGKRGFDPRGNDAFLALALDGVFKLPGRRFPILVEGTAIHAADNDFRRIRSFRRPSRPASNAAAIWLAEWSSSGNGASVSRRLWPRAVAASWRSNDSRSSRHRHRRKSAAM